MKILGRIALLLAFFSGLVVYSVTSPPQEIKRSVLSQEEWVDSVFNSLTPEQRVGQLFMVAAYSNKGEAHMKEMEVLIANYGIGGLIFFQGGPVRQAQLTNHYQSMSKVPLLIAMDAEWGLGMRLDSTISYPKQMTLGAIQDNRLVYGMGAQIARECRRLGVHVNFAPVVDVNNNPANPVIGMRSFGEDRENVTEKGLAYMKGMQHNGVMANAKHFPGHGDTESDSHKTLPVINASKARMDSLELYPFRRLIADSVMSVMVAHVQVPSLDKRDNMPSTLSDKIITDLLKNEMGFKGIIFTDALNMKGVSALYKPGEVDVRALLAGNDVMLYSEDVPLAIEKFLKAIKTKDITQEEVDFRVKKVLRGKYWCGLHTYRPIQIDNLYNDLNSSKGKAIRQELYERSVTLVKNDKQLLPLKYLDTLSIATVSIGMPLGNSFQQTIDQYAQVDHYAIANKKSVEAVYDSLLERLSKYEVVLIGLQNTNIFNSRNFGIEESSKRFIQKLQTRTNTVLTVFGNPYALKFFIASPNMICAYEDNETTYSVAAQMIFGGVEALGKLPVTACLQFPLGTGLPTLSSNVTRLHYGYPEQVRMDGNTLLRIDTIMNRAIAEGATPGGQIMVVKNGTVVYQKNFGYTSYYQTQAVNNRTMYDVASVTKVAATTQALMFLYDQGLINLDLPASHYLTELKGTNKEKLIIRDILTHQAGLVPFLMHWKKTMDSGQVSMKYYSRVRTEAYPNQVTDSLYSIASMEDSLWKWTIKSDLLPHPRKGRKILPYTYTYSDLSFYFAKKLVERIVNQPIDEFMQQNFYDRLGLSTMGYKPLDRFPKERIAPTEDDKYFRHQLVQGTVHDQGACMNGGVAGHAGLFSNANDLAILMQMNLMYGCYGGQRYILPETIGLFTQKQFPHNRRGLGWDKPEPAGNGPTSDWCSERTFGHTGFTGTAVWADPDQQLVYIFLSNRVNTDAGNNRLIKQGIRTKVQDVIYRAILNYRD